MRLELREVPRYAFDQVERMREIRNSCRSFMTRDRTPIAPERQTVWWAGMHDKDEHRMTWRPYLLWRDDDAIGYGILWHGSGLSSSQVESREARSAWWLSGGLIPEHRGNGYGRFLFGQLVERAGRPCWLEVRSDNANARALYERLGFQTVAVSTLGIVTMRLP